MTSAVVVGAGPNGLAGAVVLAQAGVQVTVYERSDTIGGGARSAQLTVPGLVHDVCSAVHPLAVNSPFLRSLDLARHGLEWCWPEIDLAHPLDDGRVGVLRRDLDQTTAALGLDGARWRRLVGPLADDFDDLADDLLRPPLHVPRHPTLLARFGQHAVRSAAAVVRHWRTDEARALFGGVAAHAMRPLTSPTTAAVGLALALAAHRRGWPVARGGSQAIVDALAAELHSLGGRIETEQQVTSLAEVAGVDIVLLDLVPARAVEFAGSRLPRRVAHAYERFRAGPGVFKVDLAIEGGVPWTDEACRRAGTVHLGGTFEQIAAAEADVARGAMPPAPFVLVAQQYLADPARSVGDVHPVWAYAHVPHGYRADATEAVLGQLERFAPGVRRRVVASAVRGTDAYERYNPNILGGDIGYGATDPVQLVFRPRPALDPYATGIPGVYLCSAATPPGAGVHGMCGANAAAAALRRLVR